MQNNSPTEAGRSSGQAELKLAQVDAINQVFTLFRLNYHNQYLKAFGNTQELNEVKRLWLDMLSRFKPEVILRGAKTIIENSEFLPTLHSMIHACERACEHRPVPDAHSAYIEACRAPSPKTDFAWSHPLVYHAGKKTDWYFLQTSSEAVAYPVFKKHFETLLEAYRGGEPLPDPTPKALPSEINTPLDKTQQQEKLKALRSALDI